MVKFMCSTLWQVVAVCAVVTTVACGGSGSSSLAGPSGVSGSGATITGRVNSGGSLGGRRHQRRPGIRCAGRDVHDRARRIGRGTTITATLDGGGQFTLTGLPEGTHRLSFRGPGTDARITITVSADERVSISVTVNGTSARIESENRSGGRPNGQIEIEGLVTDVDPRVPNTLRVAGRLVTVPPGARIRHGNQTLPFSTIGIGDRVHVKAVPSGGGYEALEVNVQNQNGGNFTEAEGVVSVLAGTCPDLTFRVGTTIVRTNGVTVFRDGRCGALLNGDVVEVRGTRGNDGVITAVSVENEDGDDDDDRPGRGRLVP